jgi:hypothetical protein
MDGCLRGRWIRPGGELAQRVRWMPEPELRSLAKRAREPRQAIFCLQPFDGLELESRRAARSHEVGVVGVGEPICTCARLGDHRALLERENRLRRSHLREYRLDRLPALRIRDRVPGSLGQGELDAVRAGDLTEKRRRGRRRRSQLEMRRARHRDGPAAEKCATQVGRTAARATDDAARRPLERSMSSIDDTRRFEDAQGVGIAGNVQLVARCPVEGTAPIGADLRADLARAEERERAAGRGATPQIEVQRPIASCSKVQAAGRVKESGQLGPLIARATRSNSRELLSHVFGGDHGSTPSSASSRRLTATPVVP